MSSLRKNQTKLSIFSVFGKQVIKRLYLIFVFAGICLFGGDHLQRVCPEKKSSANNTISKIECFLSPLSPFIINFGFTLLQSGLVIWFIDIGLKIETVEEIKKYIKEVVESIEIAQHIQSFYRTKSEYWQIILRDFEKSIPGETIKILGLFEEIKMIGEFKRGLLKNKIISGCHLKILIPHPESSLMKCLSRGGYPYSGESINDYVSTLKLLCQEVKMHNGRVSGSLELRYHKNLFSPCCYYSSKDLKMMYIYLHDFDGYECPAFKIGNQEFVQNVDDHFNYLWRHSEKIVYSSD